jgi:hypothetical protein
VAHVQDVQPGVTDNGVTQVDGINPGDIVANSSFDKLQDNAKVVIASAGPSGAYGSHGGHGGESAGAGGSASPGRSPHAHHSPHPHHTPEADQ